MAHYKIHRAASAGRRCRRLGNEQNVKCLSVLPYEETLSTCPGLHPPPPKFGLKTRLVSTTFLAWSAGWHELTVQVTLIYTGGMGWNEKKRKNNKKQQKQRQKQKKNKNKGKNIISEVANEGFEYSSPEYLYFGGCWWSVGLPLLQNCVYVSSHESEGGSSISNRP